jgi:hypothetical protein
MYIELKQFKDKHNHCNIPYPTDRALSSWTNAQRQLYKKGRLAVEQITLLESIGFIWEPQESHWLKMYSELKQFKDEHNHCNIPDKKFGVLSRWGHAQRQSYKKGKLSLDKIQKLQAIGFQWILRNRS